MWLLSHKTPTAMELFGPRLIKGSGSVHNGVFDGKHKSGRWELEESEAQAYHVGWERAELDEVDVTAYDWCPPENRDTHCLFVTWPRDKLTTRHKHPHDRIRTEVWSKQATRDDPPFKMRGCIVRKRGYGE